MTLVLEIVLVALPAVFLTLPVLWSWRFVAVNRRNVPVPGTPLRAVVVLPLRGADPFLGDCLAGLLRQDYPCYRIHIVIDSEDDPAWGPVRRALAEAPGGVPVRVETLRRRLGTCSLKVSSLIQAASELDEADEAVVLIDADAAPASNWLRSLTAPLADPAVGAANGNRWFVPRRPDWGSLVRRLWNAASITQMLHFGMPWGGSLAVRARLFRETDLSARLGRSFCDDSGIGDAIRALSLRLEFAPGAIMVNRESISLANCFGWIRRQLLCPRLDLAVWPRMLTANAGMLAGLACCITLFTAGCLTGTWRWAAEAVALLAWYVGGLLAALVVGEGEILQKVRERGQDGSPMGFTWRLPAAFVLTHPILVVCLVHALVGRRVRWRGATYAVDAPGRVRLLEYRPYQDANPGGAAGKSIL